MQLELSVSVTDVLPKPPPSGPDLISPGSRAAGFTGQSSFALRITTHQLFGETGGSGCDRMSSASCGPTFYFNVMQYMKLMFVSNPLRSMETKCPFAQYSALTRFSGTQCSVSVSNCIHERPGALPYSVGPEVASVPARYRAVPYCVVHIGRLETAAEQTASHCAQPNGTS